MNAPNKPILIIPDDVVSAVTRVFGNNTTILPFIHDLVHAQVETWNAIRGALDNLENGYLQTTHVRPKDFLDDKISPKGGCTIVFAIPPRRANMITIAVSWCHEKDTFDPKLGRMLAALNYTHNRCIQMRLPHKGNYSRQLKFIFQNTVPMK